MPNFTVEFKAMGSHIQAWLNAPGLNEAKMLQEVPGWFEAWEQQFSRFRPTSELSELNRHAGEWWKVSPSMFEVITLAIRGAEDTKGLFNPLILNALQAAGYDHSFEPGNFVPGQHSIEAFIPNMDQIALDPEEFLVRLPENGQIDLGGIVKGWAAQQTANTLGTAGPCMVDAGGDIVAVGSPDEQGGWLVSVANPVTSEIVSTVLLTDSAIATSGRDYRTWLRDGQSLHHIIDPRTGQPAASDVLTVSVIAPDAVNAEIWAKAAMIDGDSSHYPTLLFHSDGSMVCNEELIPCQIDLK